MLGLLVVCFIFFLPSSESMEICNKIDLPRIVGGEDINVTQVPYQLSLEHPAPGNEYYTVCGAAIISRLWGITAAHCLSTVRAQLMRLRCGITHLNEEGSIHKVEFAEKHPKYERKPHKNDIALLKVDREFQYSVVVKPIKLASTAPPADTVAIVSGWGVMEHGGAKTRHLQQVVVFVLEPQACLDAYGEKFRDGMLCAGYPYGGRDACQGDSGGPLVADGELVGVVSWGEGCAQGEFPGVYADIAYFRPWIISVIGDTEN